VAAALSDSEAGGRVFLFMVKVKLKKKIISKFDIIDLFQSDKKYL
jgi:hypothetical protein